MQSSNPLIAVGISAVLAIGSATAATAQTESSANAAANDSKEGRPTAIGSPRSEKQEHDLVTQLPRDLVRELREAQQEEDDTDGSSENNLNNEQGNGEDTGQDSDLAQDVLDEAAADEADADEAEDEPSDPEVTESNSDSSNSESSEAEPAQDASAPESTTPDAAEAIDSSQESTSENQLSDPDETENSETSDETETSESEDVEAENSQENSDTTETNEAQSDRDEVEAAQGAESTNEEPVEDSQDDETQDEDSQETETTDDPESTPEAQADDSEPTEDDETNEDEDTDALPTETRSEESEESEESDDEDPNITTPVPNTSEPAPDYLDPDPNPLSFPTQPEEVEIVGTQPITLAQAIDLAIRNNAEVQQNRLELQRAQAALREAEAANYPTVDVDANLGLSGQESPDAQQTFDPTTGGFESEVDGTELQTSLVLGGEVSVNYNIYTSGRRSALIEASERQVRFQELEVESIVEDLILQITNDYYALQEADEQVQIFQAAVDEAERSLRDAEALERAGVGTRFDVLQAQVDLANAVQDLTNQRSQQEIARRQLAERLNLSQSVTLAAAEPVEVAGVWELNLEETIVQAFQNRAELQQALVRREIAERNRRAALAQLGPQVGVGASYGLNNTLASDPESAAEEVGFLSNFQVQLGVSLRLFDGGQARAQARQAEADIAIAETEFANTRDQVRFEVEQAFSELQSNFENIQTTALAVQQAAEALRLARLRFQAGVGTQTDVLRSQTALTQARFNNLRAILDYNRALASLQRSVSNLPEGYLNEVP